MNVLYVCWASLTDSSLHHRRISSTQIRLLKLLDFQPRMGLVSLCFPATGPLLVALVDVSCRSVSFARSPALWHVRLPTCGTFWSSSWEWCLVTAFLGECHTTNQPSNGGAVVTQRSLSHTHNMPLLCQPSGVWQQVLCLLHCWPQLGTTHHQVLLSKQTVDLPPLNAYSTK